MFPNILLILLPFSLISNVVRCQVMCDSLWHLGLQHARLSCPSTPPGVCPNSCPLNQWYRSIISSSVAPFSYCLLSQHQGLFQWVSGSSQVVKVLELQLHIYICTHTFHTYLFVFIMPGINHNSLFWVFMIYIYFWNFKP